MSHERPEANCEDLIFEEACALRPPAQVALEDYARVLAGAQAAETLPRDDDTRVTGVHLCGAAQPLGATARADVIAFARELVASETSGGLGWS